MWRPLRRRAKISKRGYLIVSIILVVSVIIGIYYYNNFINTPSNAVLAFIKLLNEGYPEKAFELYLSPNSNKKFTPQDFEEMKKHKGEILGVTIHRRKIIKNEAYVELTVVEKGYEPSKGTIKLIKENGAGRSC